MWTKPRVTARAASTLALPGHTPRMPKASTTLRVLRTLAAAKRAGLYETPGSSCVSRSPSTGTRLNSNVTTAFTDTTRGAVGAAGAAGAAPTWGTSMCSGDRGGKPDLKRANQNKTHMSELSSPLSLAAAATTAVAAATVARWHNAVLAAPRGSNEAREAMRQCALAAAAAGDTGTLDWLRARADYAPLADEATWDAQRSALEAAVRRNEPDSAAFAGAPPRVLSAILLPLAAATGSLHAVHALVRAGAQPHADACAALLAAVRGRHLDTARVLLEHVVAAVARGAFSHIAYHGAMARARAAAATPYHSDRFTLINAAPVPVAVVATTATAAAAAAAVPPPPPAAIKQPKRRAPLPATRPLPQRAARAATSRKRKAPTIFGSEDDASPPAPTAAAAVTAVALPAAVLEAVRSNYALVPAGARGTGIAAATLRAELQPLLASAGMVAPIPTAPARGDPAVERLRKRADACVRRVMDAALGGRAHAHAPAYTSPGAAPVARNRGYFYPVTRVGVPSRNGGTDAKCHRRRRRRRSRLASAARDNDDDDDDNDNDNESSADAVEDEEGEDEEVTKTLVEADATEDDDEDDDDDGASATAAAAKLVVEIGAGL